MCLRACVCARLLGSLECFSWLSFFLRMWIPSLCDCVHPPPFIFIVTVSVRSLCCVRVCVRLCMFRVTPLQGGEIVQAVAHDNPIPGFDTYNTINLRLWKATPSRGDHSPSSLSSPPLSSSALVLRRHLPRSSYSTSFRLLFHTFASASVPTLRPS